MVVSSMSPFFSAVFAPPLKSDARWGNQKPVRDTVQFGAAAVQGSQDAKKSGPLQKTGFRWILPNAVSKPSAETKAYVGVFSDAARVHEGQRRRVSDSPFMLHPVEVVVVAATLARATPVELTAASLHDAMEDQPERYKRMLRYGMVDRDVDAVVQAATQFEMADDRKEGLEWVARVGEKPISANSLDELKKRAKLEGRRQFIESVRRFPNDRLLASKIVVIGADKIVGMRNYIQEIRDDMLSRQVPSGKTKSPYDKFFDMKNETLAYYYHIALALWERWDKLPKPEQERLRPLMYEVTHTYFDLNLTIKEAGPVSAGDLRALLEKQGPPANELIP